VAWAASWRRRRASEAPGERPPGSSTGLVALLPVGLALALFALRLLPPPSRSGEIEAADRLASRAYAEERWEAAAEYARHAVDLLPPTDPRWAGLQCVRGEALRRAGHPREAIEPFAQLVEREAGPHRPQALYSGALARESAGDVEGAAQWRGRLAAEHPATPWAQRAAAEREGAGRGPASDTPSPR
jgi:tetratricopeptide (TPR) repeat protein